MSTNNLVKCMVCKNVMEPYHLQCDEAKKRGEDVLCVLRGTNVAQHKVCKWRKVGLPKK